MSVALGIDLGTTNSMAYIYRTGGLEKVPIPDGSSSLPSCIAFTPVQELYGNAARNHTLTKPEEVAAFSKRLIGKAFDDPEVQEDIANFPFQIKESEGRPYYVFPRQNTTIAMTPEQISGKLLKYIKESAEIFVREHITQAVITVPAKFGAQQREATLKAVSECTDLQLLQIIDLRGLHC